MHAHPSLAHVGHRPWPLPEQPWKWRQSWLDLAFIHFRVSASALASKLPPTVRLQEFEGSAWVGLVPFRMAGVMRRPFPDLPSFSNFPELNLRTYVEVGGKPGVWFFSLDAASWPIVFGGRNFYHLPYFRAKITHHSDGNMVSFSSRRHADGVRFEATFRPTSSVFLAEAGTFEHWASERYCLYSHSARHGLTRVEVHHAPWPLQLGTADIQQNEILHSAGISALPEPPRVHYTKGVEVVSFSPEKIA